LCNIQGKCCSIATEGALFAFGAVTYVYLVLQVTYLIWRYAHSFLLWEEPQEGTFCRLRIFIIHW